MLYLLHMGNHPEVTYTEGQDPIVHLEADLHEVVDWANSTGTRWAFSLSNAGANYTEFRSNLADLPELNWTAIQARDWRDPDVKEGKQAEFLVHGSFPFDLVRNIGVRTEETRRRAIPAIRSSRYGPPMTVTPRWYY
jgi:hypothetical protein